MLTVALSDDAQKRLIVAPATLSGKPAASAAHRATSPMPSCAGLTQPAITSSIWSSSTPTRSHAPVIANPSRSSSRICDSEPPYRVNGVRTPPSTNASVIVDSQLSRRTTDVADDVDCPAQGGQPGIEGVSRRIEPDGVHTGVAPHRQSLPHHGFGADE